MPTPDKSKQIARYISDSMAKAESYKTNVSNGSQLANRWIKLAVQRSRNDATRTDIYFDPREVARVYEFFYFANISDGERYRRFNLTPYQAWILSEIFGWFYTGHQRKRRYRYALLYTARKSGKTVFFVVVEFLILMYDQQEAPEAYLCATTREQAGQALRYSKDIIANSPALRKRLIAQQFQILYKKRSGLMKVLANKPEKNDSLNPSIYIMDEMHAHPTLDFLNVMKSGTMFRKNPLGIITSTAGFNKEYPFYTMLQTGQKVLEGILEDDITFYALYTLDEDDEIEHFDKWEKANPNIGHTVRLDDLVAEYRKSKLTISELNNFITKNLNRYLDNIEQWIPDEQYVKCFRTIAPPTGQRVPAFIGLDLSSVRDIAAIEIVWTDPATGHIATISEFHFPQNESRKIRESGIDLGEWIQKGHIIEHPTNSINQEIIFERIKHWNTVFEIIQINYDKWNSGFIIPKVETELFIFCQHFNQTTVWFNFPLKYIERLFFEETIAMTTNPVMRWMFANIQLYYDGNGNIKIMKNKSRDSVDGPVALGMAIGAWLQFNGDASANFFRELFRDKLPEPPAASSQ